MATLYEDDQVLKRAGAPTDPAELASWVCERLTTDEDPVALDQAYQRIVNWVAMQG